MSRIVFARNMKHLREKKGLTQTAMAEKLGVGVKQYQAWEEARAYPTIPVFIMVCDSLRIKNIYRLVTTLLK